MRKSALFVTYGGGHAPMIIPVVRELMRDRAIKVECLALTTAGQRFQREGLPYKGFKDFLRPDDQEAIRYGRTLAAEHHSPDSGVDEDEAVAYLGLSYSDMVSRLGADAAAEEWRQKRRHAFLPITIFERIFDELRPDVVITTNSPRAERAALAVGNSRRIPTIALTDLFGIGHFYPLEAKQICAFTPSAVDAMINEGVKAPREAFKTFGNPAFDAILELRGPTDYGMRNDVLPEVPPSAKMLLWVDMPGYWKLPSTTLHMRSDDEVLRDLDDLLAAAQANGCWLAVRPHPSQRAELHRQWMLSQDSGSPVVFAGEKPLYPLLKCVDAIATYTSTVGVEALLMERPVLQLKYHEGRSDMPLGNLGMAWEVNSREELSDQLRAALRGDDAWEAKRRRIAELLPRVRAAPLIADLVRQAVS